MSKDIFQVTIRYGRKHFSVVEKIEGADSLIRRIEEIVSIGRCTSFSVRDLSRISKGTLQ
jgi:hypothetical protein